MTTSSRKTTFTWGIQGRLIFFSLIIALVPVAIVAVVAFFQARASLQQQIGATVLELAGETGSALESFVEFRQDDIEVIARSSVLTSLTSLTEQKEDYLHSLREIYGVYAAFYVTNFSGEIIAATNQTSGDQSGQIWFQEAREGRVYASDVHYLLSTQRIVITLSAPILNSRGDFLGVVAGHIDARYLFDVIAQTQVGEDGEIKLLNSEGRIVVDGHSEEVFSDLSDLAPVQAALRGETGTAVDIDGETGEPALFAYTPLAGVEGWYALGILPLAELNAPADVLATNMALIASVAAVVISVAVFVVARRIVYPIRQLTVSAQQIATGNLAADIPVHSADEIGQLADTFRSMAAQLQGFFGTLEERIAARTTDLAITIEVGALATSIRSQDEMLPKIVEFIRARFGLYYTQIYLLDEAKRYAYLRAGTGKIGEQLLGRGHRLDMSETSLVAASVRQGAPVLVRDTETSPIHKKNPLLPDTRSEITIPLVLGGEILGVLDLQAVKAETFNDDNLGVFQALANQLAAALGGVQAYDEAQAAIARAEAINHRLTSDTWQPYLERLSQEQTMGYQYDLEAPKPLEGDMPAQADNAMFQPVLLRGQQIGKIQVQEDHERQWDAEELRLVQDVAVRVGQALEQFRAFDDVKSAQQTAAQERNLLRTLIDSIPDAIYIKDAQARFITCNVRQSSLIIKASRSVSSLEEIVGKTDLDLFPDNGAQYYADELAILESGEPMLAKEEPIIELDGSPGWHLTSKLPVRDAGGNIVGLVGIGINITERKRQEDQIRQYANMSELLARANAALSQANDEAAILTVGAILAERYGVTLSTLAYCHTDEDGNPIATEIVAMRSGDGDILPLDILPMTYMKTDEFPFARLVYASPNEPVFISDVTTDERCDELVRSMALTTGVRALVMVPLQTDQWQGILSFSWQEPQAFGQDMHDVFAAIMPNAASVVANRRAQLQVETALSNLNRVYTMSVDLIGSANFEGYFTVLNPAWTNTVGWTAEELRAKPFVEFVHPDDVAKTNAEAAKIAEGAKAISFENRYLCKDGSYKWISWNATPDVPNGLIHFVARDVTRQKENEVSQERLTTILETTSDFVAMADPQGTVLYLNHAGRKMIGIGLDDDITNTTIPEYYPEWAVQTIMSEALPVAARDGVWSGETVFLTRDGRQIPVLEVIMSHKGPDGQIERFSTIVRDISDLKRQEEAMRENEAQLAEAQRIAQLGRWTWMPQTNEVTWNDQLYDLYQIPHDTPATFDGYMGLIHPDDLGVVNSWLEAALQTTGDTMTSEYRIIRPDGVIRHNSVIGRTTRDKDGNLVKAVGIVQDITEQKRQEIERQVLYEAANKLNNAQIADELLDAITGYARDKGALTASLLYLDHDRQGNPEWANIVATWEAEGAVTMPAGSRFYLPDFPFSSLWIGNPDAPTFVANSETDPQLDDTTRGLLAQVGTQSMVLLPMHTQGRWVALASISWRDPQQFSDDDIRIYSALMRQATAKADALRAASETQRAREEAETLYRISRRLTNARSLDEMLEATLQYAHNKDVYSASLMYIDSDKDGNPVWAEIVGGWVAEGGVTAPVGTRLYLPEFPFAKLWTGTPQEPTLVGDAINDPSMDEGTRELFRQFNIAGIALLPLYTQDRWIGLLSFSWNQPTEFSEQDERVFRSITRQATSVADALRSSAQTQKRAVELATVALVSTAATTILDVDNLLEQVVDLTRESFNLYHAHVYLLDDAGEFLVLAAGAGEAGRIMKEQGHSIPLSRENSLVARAARTRQGVIANDVTQSPNFLPNPLLPDTKSEMAVPMVVGDEVIGVLDVQARVTNHFTEEDVRIETTLADQIAVAVRNARAFERERRTAERLREVDRLKSQFLANMSHELRTPLNSIIGYSEVLLDGGDGDLSNDAVEDVQTIHGSGQHLLAIINDILDLAKIEAGQMQISRQNADLVKFLTEVIHAGQILVKDKPVTLTLVKEGDIANVHADPIRLRQIVWNLVSNAVKFTEKGEVIVTIGMQDEKTVYVRVTDTGIGIQPEDVHLVFDQFRQVDGSSTRRAGGTGLGLTITRHLVRLHGGDVYVESEFGEGSSFWFTLPVFAENGA